jgi:type IV secretory pathway VirB3-like protein
VRIEKVFAGMDGMKQNAIPVQASILILHRMLMSFVSIYQISGSMLVVVLLLHLASLLNFNDDSSSFKSTTPCTNGLSSWFYQACSVELAIIICHSQLKFNVKL